MTGAELSAALHRCRAVARCLRLYDATGSVGGRNADADAIEAVCDELERTRAAMEAVPPNVFADWIEYRAAVAQKAYCVQPKGIYD